MLIKSVFGAGISASILCSLCFQKRHCFNTFWISSSIPRTFPKTSRKLARKYPEFELKKILKKWCFRFPKTTRKWPENFRSRKYSGHFASCIPKIPESSPRFSGQFSGYFRAIFGHFFKRNSGPNLGLGFIFGKALETVFGIDSDFRKC